MENSTLENPEVVVELAEDKVAEVKAEGEPSKDGTVKESEVSNDDTEGENQSQVELKEDEEDWDVDPATLIERGNRKGSRFATDGTPLCLRSFLDSGSPDLHFYFHFKEKAHEFESLENDVDRRVSGKKTRYLMREGEFVQSEPFSSSAIPYQRRDRDRAPRYKLADIYLVRVDLEMKFYVALKPGNKIPLITDLNPHQEGFFDHRRAIFLPYTEDKNIVMNLPKTQDLFFTSQTVSGGEIFVAYDNALRQYWTIVVNQVYIPSKDSFMSAEEVCWRRAVENQAYVERVLHLLLDLGSNVELVLRITPATKFLSTSVGSGGQKVHPAQQRIDNYFRDETINSKGHLRCYYYEEAVMLYGFCDDGDWKFGLKDRTSSNGHKICVQAPTSLYMYLEEANFPI